MTSLLSLLFGILFPAYQESHEVRGKAEHVLGLIARWPEAENWTSVSPQPRGRTSHRAEEQLAGLSLDGDALKSMTSLLQPHPPVLGSKSARVRCPNCT